MPNVAFFVCGTPSNNDGFQYVELGPEKLPGSPESYLDRAPSEAIECHQFQSVPIGAKRYVDYRRVLRINPNDSHTNRGAYIAVGCLIGDRIAMQGAANCIDIASELYGAVCSSLGRDRSFPVGYRLADYVYHGPPLADRLAYPCSPLLLSDMLLQALNNEGSLDWQGTKQVFLAPAEIKAGDVDRYQHYSSQGALGSLLSLDKERAEVHRAARKTAMAANLLGEVRDEWESLHRVIEGGADRLFTKTQALRELAGEIDAGLERDLLPRGASPSAGDGHSADTDGDAGNALREYALSTRRLASGQGQALLSNRGRQVPGRGRHSRTRSRGALASPRWAKLSAYVVIGIALGVLGFFALRETLQPQSAFERTPLPETSPVPDQAIVEQGPDETRNDIASERAALDQLPNE